MLVCKLCSLHIEAIPDDAILVGKLQRFSNGEFHLLRKKLEPRTGPRPRKGNPDREAPIPEAVPPTIAVPPPPKPKAETEMKETKVKMERKETKTEVFVPNESSMERAFRLAAA